VPLAPDYTAGIIKPERRDPNIKLTTGI